MTLDRLVSWTLPPPPLGLKMQRLRDLQAQIRVRLSSEPDPESRSQLELEVAEWLFELVRANVKRGRAFELEEVLATRQADCLGYARLLTFFGSRFGLDMGVVEVIIDLAGRHVPHHANLLNLSSGDRRLLDLWYASPNISHRRIGALADGKLRDLDREELPAIRQLRGLPRSCLRAITLYIQGNRRLERNELAEAISLYTQAIRLYPQNSRAFYNRGVAFEKKGDRRRAEEDYRRALSDEASLARVLARVEELEKLIELDAKGLSREEQEVYLLHQGFRTGTELSAEEISRRLGMPLKRVKEVLCLLGEI